MDEDMLNLKIFISRSKIRKEVLEKLNESPEIATFLQKKLNKHLSTISKTLIELNKLDLIKCLNPKDDRFRKYIITKLGKEVLKNIK